MEQDKDSIKSIIDQTKDDGSSEGIVKVGATGLPDKLEVGNSLKETIGINLDELPYSYGLQIRAGKTEGLAPVPESWNYSLTPPDEAVTLENAQHCKAYGLADRIRMRSKLTVSDRIKDVVSESTKESIQDLSSGSVYIPMSQSSAIGRLRALSGLSVDFDGESPSPSIISLDLRFPFGHLTIMELVASGDYSYKYFIDNLDEFYETFIPSDDAFERALNLFRNFGCSNETIRAASSHLEIEVRNVVNEIFRQFEEIKKQDWYIRKDFLHRTNYSNKKYKRLTKRNKKRIHALYSGKYFNRHTDKIIADNSNHRSYAKPVPITHHCIEHDSAGISNIINTWIKLFLNN